MSPNVHATRIMLADDHAVVRLGLRLLLEGAGATVVGFSPDGVGHGSPAALRAAGAQWVLSDMALLTKMI